MNIDDTKTQGNLAVLNNSHKSLSLGESSTESQPVASNFSTQPGDLKAQGDLIYWITYDTLSAIDQNRRTFFSVKTIAKIAAPIFLSFLAAKSIPNSTRIILTVLGGVSTYKLFDQGLADFLNLETLQHGTNFEAYVKINLFGTNPNLGGSDTGSTVGLVSLLPEKALSRISDIFHSTKERTENYFYLFKDSSIENVEIVSLRSRFACTVLAHMHAVLSDIGKVGPFLALHPVTRFFFTTITPVLKFRFKKEDVINPNSPFENDPDYFGMAYKIKQPIGSIHLGVVGSITQGISREAFSRMAQNIEKVVHGMQLLGLASITGLATRNIYRHGACLGLLSQKLAVQKIAAVCFTGLASAVTFLY